MTPTEMTIEELAPRTEDEVREHLAAGKLVEGLQHMSPEYLRGIRRILTVSGDTELVSAPAYLRAARHAPALNNFGSALALVQDEVAHAPLNSWVEMGCANALYDQAGFTLLGDVHKHSTFGPWKRALAKVDKEETFHLRHGRTWLKKIGKDP